MFHQKVQAKAMLLTKPGAYYIIQNITKTW